MTTEDDFQKALDAHPDDWQTRLVFADWLEERGDARAEGYRALGVLRKHPHKQSAADWTWQGADSVSQDANKLTRDWMFIVSGFTDGRRCWPLSPRDAISRREAEDAAALAFAKLPPARRAELLNQTAGAA